MGVWDSPFVNRVEILLNLKGISYEYVEEDLHNKGELLLTSNPVHKKVPVLIHNGKAIPESQVILQYIDEAWPSTGPTVLPVDPLERATARFWAAFVDDKVSNHLSGRKQFCGKKVKGPSRRSSRRPEGGNPKPRRRRRLPPNLLSPRRPPRPPAD